MARSLPDAPLDMPKQMLERRSFFDVIRLTLSAITGR
jgi:hypothetical protein